MTDSRRIAVCSWSLQPDGPQHLCELLDRLDIRAVQLALNPIVVAPALWAGAIDLLCGAGCTIVSGMMNMTGEDYSTLDSIGATGGVRPDQHWDENLRLARDVAALAGRSGIGLVTFHAGFLPEVRDDPERQTMVERLCTIADVFADRGVNVAFETGQETADTLLEVLSDIDRETVGVNFDPANMILYGKGDPVDALRSLSSWVRQVHIKDALPAETPGQWGTEVPAGQGDVDWPAFFEVAETLDPPAHYIIERETGDERISDIRTAIDLIKEHMTMSNAVG